MFKCVTSSYVTLCSMQTTINIIIYVIFTITLCVSLTLVDVLRISSEEVEEWNVTLNEFDPDLGTRTVSVHVSNPNTTQRILGIISYSMVLVATIMIITEVIVAHNISEYKESLKVDKDKRLTETLLNKV